MEQKDKKIIRKGKKKEQKDWILPSARVTWNQTQCLNLHQNRNTFHQIPFAPIFRVSSFEHSDAAARRRWFQPAAKGIIKSRFLPWLSLWCAHLPAAARWWAAESTQPWEAFWITRRALGWGGFLVIAMEAPVRGKILGWHLQGGWWSHVCIHWHRDVSLVLSWVQVATFLT